MADPANEALGKVWDNATVLANLIDAIRFNRDAPASELWSLQRIWNHAVDDETVSETDRVDFHTISKAAWLAHPDRMTDLDRTTLNAFRFSVKKNVPFEDNNLLDHLPLHVLEDLKSIMTRQFRMPGNGLRVPTTDQLAAVYHLSRLGASIPACQSFFSEPINDKAITVCRSMTQETFGPINAPGWNWPS